MGIGLMGRGFGSNEYKIMGMRIGIRREGDGI